MYQCVIETKRHEVILDIMSKGILRGTVINIFGVILYLAETLFKKREVLFLKV